MVISEIK